MQIGDVTISAALTWVIGAAAALATVAKAVEILIRIFGRNKKSVEERLRKHDELLDRDNKRLAELEDAMKDQQKGQAVICQGMLSLINHQLSGNDTEKLRDARDKITNYLTQR